MVMTPPAVKFELRAYGKIYDVTKDMSSWKESQFVLMRKDLSGIYLQMSFPFNFKNDAYDILEEIFNEYQHKAIADLYVYVRDDNWPWGQSEYYEPHILNLDWATYKRKDTLIEIRSRQSTLYDFLKTKEKLSIEIPVSEICEKKKWNYERIVLENYATFIGDVETIGEYSDVREIKKTIGASLLNSEVVVKDIIEYKTVGENLTPDKDSWFLKRNQKIPMDVSLKIKGDVSFVFYGASRSKMTVTVGIYDENNNLVVGESKVASMIDTPSYDTFSASFDSFKTGNILQSNGSLLYLVIVVSFERDASGRFERPIGLRADVEIKYNAPGSPVYVDLISPNRLLQEIVDRITDTKDIYLAKFEDINISNNDMIMIAAAESIRGIEPIGIDKGAKIHTSYADFLSWIKTFGYEPHIYNNILTIKKRSKGFQKDLIAIELQEDECSDLIEEINEKFIISGVKVGYDRKEIANVNGRYDFCGVHDYSTDQSNYPNVVEFISKYKASCYEIEFLTQERGKKTTDNKSDKDVFIINVREDTNAFETIKSTFTGNSPNNTLFNGNISPLDLLSKTQDVIGISTNELRFMGSNGNSEIIINGVPIKSNYSIPKGTGIFDAISYNIASKNIQNLPHGEKINGIVKFHYKGKIYEGFIDNISKCPTWESETTWVLFKKKQ